MKIAFMMKQKPVFIIFKGLSVAKNCLRPKNAPFRDLYFINLEPYFLRMETSQLFRVASRLTGF